MAQISVLSKQSDRSVYWVNALEWFLCRSAAALGAKGTHQSVMAILEAGGPAPSGVLRDPYNESHLGERALDRGAGAVAMYRRVWSRWARIAGEHQEVLTVHYTTSRLPAGVEAAFRQPKRNVNDVAVSFGAVALYLSDGTQAARILKACEELDRQPQESRDAWRQTVAGKQRLACLEGPRGAAMAAIQEAHEAYLSTARVEAARWAM